MEAEEGTKLDTITTDGISLESLENLTSFLPEITYSVCDLLCFVATRFSGTLH